MRDGTGVVRRMWGTFVPVKGAVADAHIAEAAARAFIAEHLRELAPGAAMSDFGLVTNRLDGALRTVAFAQMWRWLRVVGGQVHVVFENDRLFGAGSEAWPNVAPREAARAGAVVLPTGGGYRVAEVEERDGWRVYTSGGEVIWRESLWRDATGTLRYDIADRWPGGPRHAIGAPNATVTADGVPTTTDASGVFSWSGSATTNVIPSASGPLVSVIDHGGAAPFDPIAIDPGGDATVSVATSELQDAVLEAFAYASIAKARARVIAPFLAPWLDTPAEIYVNEAGSCNAFSDGTVEHFYRANTACENTGRIADIVMHEFGHSVHKHAVIEGVGVYKTDLSEGLADFLAADTLDDSVLGRGLYYTIDGIRDLDPVGRESVWPYDRDVDPHITGLIVGGALWDLRKALGVETAERLYAGVLQRAADLPTAYLAALVTDDDDGDLGNGTPNYCAIRDAFGRHGLADEEFATTTVGPPVLDGRDLTVPVAVPVDDACPQPLVTGIDLVWHAGDGDAQTIALAQGDSLAWRAQFPALPDGTVVHYTVRAHLDDDTQVILPDNPADPEYVAVIGQAHAIRCWFMDSNPSFASTGSGATFAAEWEWAAPGPFTDIGDPAAAHTGTNVLGTDVTVDGGYLPSGTATIAAPAVYVEPGTYDAVHLQFWRWLSVEDWAYDAASVKIGDQVVWHNASDPRNKTLNHVDREWRFQDFDVTDAAANPMIAAWELQTDSAGGLGGWSLDDICFVGYGKHAVCGDGVVDPGEDCDGGDECSEACTLPEADGGCCSSSGNPAGSLVLAAAVLLLRRRR